MDATRRVVLTDVGLGVLCVALGLLYAGPAAVPYWWLVPVTAVVTAGLTWADDHGAVGSEWAVITVVAAFGATLLVLGFVAGSDLVSTAVVPTVLVGLGAGAVPYRVYFGLVRPVPEGRLGGAHERGT